jgi:UDP:flavonoid glycosyltransferase YjiC (YdhE family)
VRGNSVINRWIGMLAERMIWGVSGDTTNAFRAELGLAPHTNASYRRALYATPTFYGFSPNVVPPPPEWGESRSVVGYWFLDEAYTPPAALTRFLDAGAPPVYVGFGSMSTATPEGTVEMIAEALRQNGQRGIVASGWSGAAIRNPPEHIYLLDSAPHGWLFDHVAAVVHHGGAGTTGAGLRAGKPTMIIPHFSDQPYWGKRVYDLGVGAKPVTRHTLTAEKLAAGIHTLVSDAAIARQAAALGAQIRAERGVKNAVQWIEQAAKSYSSSGALKS